MFRLHAKTHPQNVSCMYYPKHTESADTLYRLGKKLPPSVSSKYSPFMPQLISRFTRMYKFSQLFGEDEDAGGELDEAEKQGENGRCRA